MGPLAGIRVLDLSRVLAGPFCTMVLGDLGADIIKVEPPEGDLTRAWGPPFLKGESGYYLSLNRNKRSLCLDLRQEAAARVLRRLVPTCDVVLENFRPGVAERLGIGYKQARTWREDVIYCSISGYGQDGPDRDRPAFDIVLQALGGFMSITGEEGRPPVRIGVAIADIGGGLHAALAILAALWGRAQTGEGALLDVSLLDGQVSWLTYMAQEFFLTGEPPGRMGSAHPHIVPYRAFPTTDGHVVVAAGTNRHWRSLCRAISREEMASSAEYATNALRVRNRTRLERTLTRIFQGRSRGDWLDRLRAEGVPCAPVQDVGEVFEDPQVVHRGLTLRASHPRLGEIMQLAPPFRSSSWGNPTPQPPPLLGEHTESILAEVGFTKERVAELREQGVVFSSEDASVGTDTAENEGGR